MAQTKLGSFIESIVSIGFGFLISLLVWLFIIKPLFGIEVSIMSNLQITGIFTFFSVLRAYLVRRYFTKRKVR